MIIALDDEKLITAAFQIAQGLAYDGRPSQKLSSPPLMVILQLLTGEYLEEVGGVKNERDGTSEAWVLQFFRSARKSRECVGGIVGGNLMRFR